MRRLFLGLCRILYSLALSSCVSWTSVDPSVVSGAIKNHFGSCVGDGLLALQVFQEDHLVVTPHAEWIAEDDQHLLMDLFSPGGATLLRIHFSSDQGLGLQGADERISRKLAVKDSILYFDENSLHLHMSELGCLLQFRFPATWLDTLKNSGNSQVYLYEDQNRQIKLDFTDPDQFCAEIAASRLFGLYRLDRLLCFRQEDGKYYGTLQIKNVGNLEWRDANDSAS